MINMQLRKAAVNPTSLVIFAGVVILVALIIFMVIGQLESQIKLTGTWNTTYVSFRTSVSNVFPLISTFLIVVVAVSIIAIMLRLFGGGAGAE